MTILEIVITTAAAVSIITIPPKIAGHIKNLLDERSYRKHRARVDEIATLRKRAGLKKLLNDSMASAMCYREYTDKCERKGTAPLTQDAFWGYTDSTDDIDPKIRARLEELGGLRG